MTTIKITEESFSWIASRRLDERSWWGYLTEKDLRGDHHHGYLRVGNPLRNTLWRDDQGEAERGDEKGDQKGGLTWGYVIKGHYGG